MPKRPRHNRRDAGHHAISPLARSGRRPRIAPRRRRVAARPSAASSGGPSSGRPFRGRIGGGRHGGVREAVRHPARPIARFGRGEGFAPSGGRRGRGRPGHRRPMAVRLARAERPVPGVRFAAAIAPEDAPRTTRRPRTRPAGGASVCATACALGAPVAPKPPRRVGSPSRDRRRPRPSRRCAGAGQGASPPRRGADRWCGPLEESER